MKEKEAVAVEYKVVRGFEECSRAPTIWEGINTASQTHIKTRYDTWNPEKHLMAGNYWFWDTELIFNRLDHPQAWIVM